MSNTPRSGGHKAPYRQRLAKDDSDRNDPELTACYSISECIKVNIRLKRRRNSFV